VLYEVQACVATTGTHEPIMSAVNEQVCRFQMLLLDNSTNKPTTGWLFGPKILDEHTVVAAQLIGCAAQQCVFASVTLPLFT
jgi:hypothetical protein